MAPASAKHLKTLPGRICCLSTSPQSLSPQVQFESGQEPPECLNPGSFSSGEVLGPYLWRRPLAGPCLLAVCLAGPPPDLPSLCFPLHLPPSFLCVNGHHIVLATCRHLVAKLCYRDICLGRLLRGGDRVWIGTDLQDSTVVSSQLTADKCIFVSSFSGMVEDFVS